MYAGGILLHGGDIVPTALSEAVVDVPKINNCSTMDDCSGQWQAMELRTRGSFGEYRRSMGRQWRKFGGTIPGLNRVLLPAAHVRLPGIVGRTFFIVGEG
jgi:hypothetical protein